MLVLRVLRPRPCLCVCRCWCWHRLFDRTLCTALYEDMIENPEAVVLSVRENVRRKWKPTPLATVAMQTIASRKLGMSSKESLDLAEELYQHGFIRCVAEDVMRSNCGVSRDVQCALDKCTGQGRAHGTGNVMHNIIPHAYCHPPCTLSTHRRALSTHNIKLRNTQCQSPALEYYHAWLRAGAIRREAYFCAALALAE